ncbi:MAG: hypothetical protein AB7I68_14590 [Porticoccaceae bacterium]
MVDAKTVDYFSALCALDQCRQPTGTANVAVFGRRPLDQALWQIEVLFVRQDDPLRSDKRWG